MDQATQDELMECDDFESDAAVLADCRRRRRRRRRGKGKQRCRQQGE